MAVSPLINADRKGGAFPIMLQQFRRAIGISIIRGQAKLRLSRLHYVRETVAEAADICKQNHSERRWNPNHNGHSSWFSEHCPEGYGTFEQFRNGYEFCVPYMHATGNSKPGILTDLYSQIYDGIISVPQHMVLASLRSVTWLVANVRYSKF